MDDTPRSRGLWWKVSLALLALLLLVAFVGHSVWTARERANVAQRVAAIRALGEPIDPADLAEPTVPDADNAAIPFRAAAAAYVEPQPRKDRRRAMEDDDPHAFEVPLTPNEAALLRDEVADNDVALAALDDAATRPNVAWGDASPGTTFLQRLLPDLSQARQMANLLNDAATLDAHDDRSAHEILARLATIDALARPVSARRSLVPALVVVGMHAMSASTTIAIAPRLSIASQADRDACAARIASLLDDALIERQWRDGLLGERVHLREAITAVRAGTLGPATFVGTTPTSSPPQQFGAYVMRPLFYRDEATLLDYLSAALSTLDAPSFADWRAHPTAMRQILRDVDASKFAVLARILMPSLDRSFEARYRVVTTRHLAAVALAVRLFTLDHTDQLPATLAALVPEYLPRVPLDAIDGKPLRYDATRAIAWSVGADGSDEHGDETVRRPELAGELWQMRDAVVYLAPTTRPATMPSE